MKQLSKLESVIFLLGGVLMVVGAACFAFGFSHPQLVQITSWGFLLGTILFSVMQAMQIYEGPSLVIHRLKRMQYVADIFFVLSGISMDNQRRPLIDLHRLHHAEEYGAQQESPARYLHQLRM